MEQNTPSTRCCLHIHVVYSNHLLVCGKMSSSVILSEESYKVSLGNDEHYLMLLWHVILVPLYNLCIQHTRPDSITHGIQTKWAFEKVI